MPRPALTLFAAAAAILLLTGESSAQLGRTTGSSLGGAGSSSAFGGSSFGTSSFGSSSFGTSSFGGGSFGNSGFGQSAFGGQGGSTFGSSGAGQAGNQAFVGRGAADVEAFFGSINQAAQNAQRQQRSSSSRRSTSSSSTTRPEVLVAITASPELQRAVSTRRVPAAVSASNVSRLLSRKGMHGVAVSAQEGVATLEGVVASPSDKLLAEKLAAIEPGVRRVDNRLVVQSDVEEILPSPQ